MPLKCGVRKSKTRYIYFLMVYTYADVQVQFISLYLYNFSLVFALSIKPYISVMYYTICAAH